MNRTLVCLLLATALLLGLAACHKKALAPGEVRQVSMEKTPNWADNPEKASTDDARAFVGVSRQRSMEQDARTDARRDAFKQAVEALGVYVKTKLEEVASQADMSHDIFSAGIVSDEMTRIETAGITSGEVEEYFVQKFLKNVDGELRYYYTVYCRYMVPREYAVEVAMDLLEKQRKAIEDEREQKLLDRAMEKLKAMGGADF
ncbi:MAG: hypothetical protein K8R90_10105 [Candidatus Cloacimonetes bacterium]|nr:hypothetical protein [Candidatus Cloacimonadota bacterium]